MRNLLSIIVLAVSLAAICGHLTGVVHFYHWGNSTAAMGVNTALCLTLVALWQLTEKHE